MKDAETTYDVESPTGLHVDPDLLKGVLHVVPQDGLNVDPRWLAGKLSVAQQARPYPRRAGRRRARRSESSGR
jgi:hypothetical protein